MDVLERLPDAELEVMQALWAQKAYPASSGELMEALAGKLLADAHPAQTALPAGGAGLCPPGQGRAEQPLHPGWCAGRTIWPQRAGNFSKSSTRLPASLVAALMDSKAISQKDLAELEKF